MIFYVFGIFLMMLIGGKPCWKGIHADYLSKESTDAIRGIFILLIIISHFVQYVGPLTEPIDVPYQWLKTALGQSVVTPFLFYSGYGVALSAEEKGVDYVRVMPSRRIFPTLLTYDCAVLLYLIFQGYRGNRYSLKRFLQAMVACQ